MPVPLATGTQLLQQFSKLIMFELIVDDVRQRRFDYSMALILMTHGRLLTLALLIAALLTSAFAIPGQEPHFDLTDDLLFAMQRINSEGKQEVEYGIRYLEELASKHPQNPDVHYMLGIAYESASNYRRALIEYKRAVELAATHAVLLPQNQQAIPLLAKRLSDGSLFQNPGFARVRDDRQRTWHAVGKISITALLPTAVAVAATYFGFWRFHRQISAGRCSRCRSRIALRTIDHLLQPASLLGRRIEKWGRGLDAVCPRCGEVPCYVDGCKLKSELTVPKVYHWSLLTGGIKYDPCLCDQHAQMLRVRMSRAFLAYGFWLAALGTLFGTIFIIERTKAPQIVSAFSIVPLAIGSLLWFLRGEQLRKKKEFAILVSNQIDTDL